MSRPPLYRRHLGEAWAALPAPIRRIHDVGEELVAEGEAEVTRGRGLPARVAAALIGAPAAGRSVAVRVEFAPTPDGERWRRSFGGRVFASRQAEGRGAWAGLIRETFGPVTIGLKCRVAGGRLVLDVVRWTLLGLPMPGALAPYGEAYESAEDGRFRFHIEMRHVFTGLIVAYRGWLEPVVRPPAATGR
jgi:hypothetical protein